MSLKGQCHEIFCFRFFSWITFPQAPENNIRIILNFFASSRKILIILFGHLWVVELTYIYIFAFKFTLSYLQPDIVPIICHRYLPPASLTLAANLPPVSLTPVANLPPVSTSHAELVAKFEPSLANIFANFQKNSKWPLCYFQGRRRRWFMK